MNTMTRKEYGQFIVADQEICHGQLTFRGTRILVEDVLQMLAKGWDSERIAEAFGRHISPEAIAEAIELAAEPLIENRGVYRRAA